MWEASAEDVERLVTAMALTTTAALVALDLKFASMSRILAQSILDRLPLSVVEVNMPYTPRGPPDGPYDPSFRFPAHLRVVAYHSGAGVDACALFEIPALQKLTFWFYHGNDPAANAALFDLVHRIETLNLPEHDLDEASDRLLWDAVATSTTLHTLDVATSWSAGSTDDYIVHALARNTTLTTLRCGRLGMHPDTWLPHVLETNRTLTSIDAHPAGQHAASSLTAVALARNTTLTAISLPCKYDLAGLADIIDACTPQLTALTTWIHSRGPDAYRICHALRANESLTHLNLIMLEDPGLQALADGIAANTSLLSVRLDHKWTTQDVDILVAAFEQNTTITNVLLAGPTEVTPAHLDHISRITERNIAIASMGIGLK